MGQEIRGIPFTKQQAKAVTTLDQNLAITAGAGSGKTRVLTERYIEILLNEKDGLKYQEKALDKIVAITFTNKAASEMKERIRTRLEEYLSNNIQDLSSKEKEWVIKLLDDLPRAKISTIHSFCKDILKDNLFKIDLTTDFEIVEGIEQENLLKEAVIEVIDEVRFNKDHQLYDLLWELTYSYGKNKLIALLTEMLKQRQNIKGFKAELESNNLKDKFKNLITEVQFKRVKRYVNNQEIKAKVRKLKSLEAKENSFGVKIVTKIAELGTEIFSIWEQKREQGKAELTDLYAELLDCFYDFDKDKDLKIGRKMKAAHWVGGNEVKKQANHIFKELQELIPGAGKLPLEVDDSKVLREITKTLKLFSPLVKKYNQLKRKQGYFDFIDLEERVIEVLNNDYQLVTELRNKIDFMLVDEFQDTNQTQWDIIRPLVTTDKDYSNLAAAKLFVVGDPKQSIYGFRRADIRIFKEVMEQIVETNPTGKLQLSKNFRSNRELIKFTNHIFANIFANNSQEADEYDAVKQDLSFGREVKYKDKIDRDPDSQIEVLLTEYDRDDEYSKGQYEAQQIAEKIDYLVNKSDQKIFKEGKLQSVDYGDIAILMTARTRLSDYEQALEQAGIDYLTVKGIGFYQRQEIYDLYLALKALVTPEDDSLILALFRSPLFGFSDDRLVKLMRNKSDSLLAEIFRTEPQLEELFKRWQQNKEQDSLDQLIATILEDCGAYASYLSGVDGEQKIANFEKIIEEAATFSSQESNNLYLFLEQLELLMEEENKEGNKELRADSQGAVRLMTVYAAKGKEFPVVFLADLNHPGNSQTEKIISKDFGGQEQIGLQYYNEQLKKEQTSSYRILKQEEKVKEEFESKRVFYVGVTRAEEMLFSSASIYVTKRGNVTLNNGLKWLMHGLGYQSNDLVEFINSKQQQRVEELKIDSNKQQEAIEVKLIKNQTEIKEKEPSLDFELMEHPIEVNLLTSTEQEQLTTKKISPSSLAAENIEASTNNDSFNHSTMLLQEKQQAAVKGTVIHQGIEMLIKNDKIDFEYLFNSNPKIKQYSNLKEIIKEELTKLRNCSQFKRITTGVCQTEVEFCFRTTEDELLTGSIDLLTKNQKGDWIVVDWKTNQISTTQNIEASLSQYKRQLKSYQQAVKELRGVEEVKTYLYFTDAPPNQRLQQCNC